MVFTFVSIHFPFISFIVTIISLGVPLSNGEDVNYRACSTLYSCGNILDIGFPFWGGNRPKFCGIPKFKLSCNDRQNSTSMNVFQNLYNPVSVIDINTTSHMMNVFQSNVFNHCYIIPVDNSNMAFVIPNLKSDTINIRLYYGCTNCNSTYHHNFKSFNCIYFDSTYGTAYYFDKPSDMRRINKSCSCENNETFPVDRRVVEELRNTHSNGSILSILSKWPVKVKYVANFKACSECEKSGGRCGSSEDPASNQFVCHCADYGPRSLVCSPKSGGRKKLLLESGGAIGLIGTLMLVLLLIYIKKRRNISKFSFLLTRRTIKDQNVATFLKSYGSLAPKRYTYANIRKMTDSFEHKLGEGGYGSVYKGKLHDGRYVAVKKLKIIKGDGSEFMNEVLSISRTNHINVVTLLGFCFEGNKRALIFEFLPNGSLDKFMYDRTIGMSLRWETVFDISVGIAKGLDYLHRGCNTRILHFDIKPHNILLDEEFRPKISDFGLARLYLPKDSMVSMSDARGTIGYIAPEVFCRNFGGISHKSDVYSYGMMLIDLVCGRKNTVNDLQHSNDVYFPEWIYDDLENVDEDAVHKIEDDKKKELKRKLILVSLWCIQAYPSNRPSMNKVVEMLEGSLELLQMPPRPHLSSSTRCVYDSSPSNTT